MSFLSFRGCEFFLKCSAWNSEIGVSTDAPTMKHNVVPQVNALARHRLGRRQLNQMEIRGPVVANVALGFVI
jgi:hypothetical protein